MKAWGSSDPEVNSDFLVYPICEGRILKPHEIQFFPHFIQFKTGEHELNMKKTWHHPVCMHNFSLSNRCQILLESVLEKKKR